MQPNDPLGFKWFTARICCLQFIDSQFAAQFAWMWKSQLSIANY